MDQYQKKDKDNLNGSKVKEFGKVWDSPLLFVDSIQMVRNSNDGSCQKIFDSRYMERKERNVIVKKEIILANEEIKKLNNFITLYHNKMPVLCEFHFIDDTRKVVCGIPFEFDDDVLKVLVDGNEIELPLADIQSFIICSF